MGQRILKINGCMFPFLFSGEKHYRVEENPIPQDARICNATIEFPYQRDGGTAVFLLESSEWSDVPEGERIPEIMPVIKTLYEDSAD